jgi:hypothetical protein
LKLNSVDVAFQLVVCGANWARQAEANLVAWTSFAQSSAKVTKIIGISKSLHHVLMIFCQSSLLLQRVDSK